LLNREFDADVAGAEGVDAAAVDDVALLLLDPHAAAPMEQTVIIAKRRFLERRSICVLLLMVYLRKCGCDGRCALPVQMSALR
jgi:hypothetical protein